MKLVRTLTPGQPITLIGPPLDLCRHDGGGYNVVMLGEREVCDDGPETCFRSKEYYETIAAFKPAPATVAHIGGGLAIAPRLLGLAGYAQTVYEQHEGLREFAESAHAAFVPGDWRGTISGTFDVIVYDIGDAVPYDLLATHLKPGGIILPERSHA